MTLFFTSKQYKNQFEGVTVQNTAGTQEDQSQLESALTVKVFLEFELDGEYYDTVVVGWTGKKRLTLEQAIKSVDVDNHRIVRLEAGWQRVRKHRKKLPDALNGYWLITARLHPSHPRSVSYLHRVNSWCGYHLGLVNRWCDYYLLVRHRT